MSTVLNAPSLPRAGIGLKPEHYREVLETGDMDLWVEVHPENYMTDGGPRHDWLTAIREGRDLSFHGVGASLGGTDTLDTDHLSKLKALIERYCPERVSEHAAWCAHEGIYYSDLLPLPRTAAALTNLCDHIDQFQNGIGQTVLIENPTNYLPFTSEMDEPDFLVEAARRSGCGLLLDVNNVWISAHNVGADPYDYIRKIPSHMVGEIHIAGHAEDPNLGGKFLIDSHGASVSDGVWTFLEFALGKLGPKPVLLERDANIPTFEILKLERDRADAILLDMREVSHAVT